MATLHGQSHEVRVGAIVTAAVTLLFIALCSLPALWGPEQTIVNVTFPFSTGVQGIARGTPVVMGGLQFGVVDSISLAGHSETTPGSFQVSLLVDRGVVIPRTATVSVTQSVLGSGTMLVINLPIRSGDMILGPTEAIAAAPTKSTLELLLGEDRAAAFQVALTTFETFDLKPSIQDGKERWRTLANEAAALKGQADGDFELWRPQAIAVLDGFDAARKRMDEIDALFGPDQSLDRARLEPAFERMRVSFTESSQLIASMRTRWNEQVVPPFSDLVDRFKKSFAIAKSDYERLIELFDESMDTAGSVSADLQIAGRQLHAAEREITMMPWTLLGGAISDKGEQAQFNILAREIVRSATELHLSVTFAQELLAQDPKLVARYPELCELLNRWMTRAAADQNVAGERILQRLIGSQNPQ